MDDLLPVLLLRNYNTRVVVIGATAFGVAAGLVGTFMLLRKRALLGDAVGHATLPGIAGAFLLMAALGGTGKSLAGLLTGATLTGLAGAGSVVLIRRYTRLREDAALGIVLGVFFGVGAALMGLVQRTPGGNAAGLEAFIYGQTATMTRSDAWGMLLLATAAGVTCLATFKELRLLCFDDAYASAGGWPVTRLDFLLMALVTGVTVAGLQAVGLILVVAMLILPAAAARFWSERLSVLAVTSAVLGGVSGGAGALASAIWADAPSGAVIVLIATAVFGVSLLVGVERGVALAWVRRARLSRRVRREHLLRAMYESLETSGGEMDIAGRVVMSDLGTSAATRRAVRDAVRHGDLTAYDDGGSLGLTPTGIGAARRVVRNHRLWEVYMIRHADVAASHVDHGADLIEHVLGGDLVRQLERESGTSPGTVPRTPHEIAGVKR